MATKGSGSPKTDKAAGNAKQANGVTEYKASSGEQIRATRHADCDGRGCDGCNQLGFTKALA